MEVRTRMRLWNTPLRGKLIHPESRPLPKIRGVSTRASPLSRGGSINPQFSDIPPMRELRFQHTTHTPHAATPMRKGKAVDRSSLDTTHRKTLSTTVSTAADSVQLKSGEKDSPRMEKVKGDSRNVIQTPSSITEADGDEWQVMLDDDLVSYYEHELTPSVFRTTRDTPLGHFSQTPDPRSLTLLSFYNRSLLRKDLTLGTEHLEPELSSTPPLGRQHHPRIIPPAQSTNKAKTPAKLRKIPRQEDNGRIYCVPPLRKARGSPLGKKKLRKRSPLLMC